MFIGNPLVKDCFACHQRKPLDEFYRHPEMKDGHLNKCKACVKAGALENRRKNVEYYRAYDRARGSRMTAEDFRKQRKRHPEWTRAHNAVQKAKMRGKLFAQPCEICGATNVHAHHEDYSKPLDVIWLCPVHHRWIHA